ncbi:MAG TPA: glycerol-3-phosphate dehydrogenase [Woeseiaceae bacterium]|nr:glycerol-3-phosphate dehydrogenase [Woeseiaceae bacterium]
METDYDLAIIGAGINGAGIARDAALRGLSVVVFDKSDASAGTSAASSRLIHGGLRYLEYGEIPLVYESLHERRTLQHIAPHLVRPLRITIPIYQGAKRGPLLIRLGMLAYDALSWSKRLPRHDMLSRDELLAEVPGLKHEGLRGGARYSDAQVAFVERLVLENLLAARSNGASIRTWHRVSGFDIGDRQIRKIRWQHEAGGASGECSAKVVVNAAGPWVDAVLATGGQPVQALIGGTKGSHIIVSAFAGAPADAFYVEAAADGRPVFILPWNGLFLIGTTDIRFTASPDEVHASASEVDYLLDETNRIFPAAGLTRASIHYTYAGVRPLPRKKRGPESAITRKHIILQNQDLATNLVSVIGGKLTTYRSLAEQTVDRVAAILGRDLPDCRTREARLPGGGSIDTAEISVTALSQLSPNGVTRLLSLYGSRAADLALLAANDDELAVTLDKDRTVLAAEVVFAIREEFARCLVDIVYRRIMVGLAADQGRSLYESIASLAAREFTWDAGKKAQELKMLNAFSDARRSWPASA